MRRHLDDRVLTLTLDAPNRLNAVDAVTLDELAQAVEDAGSDPDVRVVVLAGEGRAFCSGADLGDEADVAGSSAATIDAANRLVRAVTSCPRPVVALARGVTAGVGVPIAVACDLVLCDEDSYLLLAFRRIGLMPDGGATALVAAAIGRNRALRLALLAERLAAVEAERVGLVTHVWSAADYDERARDLVRELVDGPAVAQGLIKQAVNAATLPGLDDAMAREREGQIGLLAAVDFREGAAAFAERRRPRFSDRP